MRVCGLVTGVGGGGFYRMKDQQVIQISSSNYGLDTYFNKDATVWRFFVRSKPNQQRPIESLLSYAFSCLINLIH